MDAARLDLLLSRLRHVQRWGGRPVETEGGSDWYEVMLFPPAAEERIDSAQTLLGKRLPEDFLHFWRYSDGANLFVNESGLHGIGVASTELIPELLLEEARVYNAAALRPYAVFARVNGAGDFLAFEVESGRVLDGVHAEQPHEWRPIAESFTDWLSALMAAEGRYYWLEELYEAAVGEG